MQKEKTERIMSWTQMLEEKSSSVFMLLLCDACIQLDCLCYGNHWTLIAAFPFYVWATDQAMCPREPIFWHPCSEWQRSPSDGQGELTAILWKLKRKWKLEQPSRVSSVLCLFTLCCYQIYCNFVRLCYVLEGQAAWILIRIINIRRFASLCVSWLFHK